MKKFYFSLFTLLFILGLISCSSPAPESPHEHEFTEDFIYNEIFHWRQALCEHTDQVLDYERHNFCDWLILEEPAEGKFGLRERNCLICPYREQEQLSPLPHTHTFSEEWSSDNESHWFAATCEHSEEKNHIELHIFGTLEETEWGTITTCQICGYEKKHYHTYSKWSINDTHHWFVPTCEHKNLKLQYGEHQFNENNKTCTICGYHIAVPEMVFVSGGTVEGKGNDGVFVEGRTVTLSDYYIGKYEVTRAEYENIMGYNPSISITIEPTYEFESTMQRPVDSVSWFDAIRYCNKLSRLEGYTEVYTINGNTVTYNQNANGYRLPTEAEWEFAARGGTPYSTDWNLKYSGSEIIEEVAWYSKNSDGISHQVGRKKPNKLGIYDMTGNIQEWCYDWYYGTLDTGNVTNPTGAKDKVRRVLRGGNFANTATMSYVFYRNTGRPDSDIHSHGFRIARSAN